MNTMHQCRAHGFENDDSWHLELALLDHLESNWQQPDEGIWEVRGDRQHFVHSKVMCWLAFDRAVKAVRRFGREGPVERWEKERARIFQEVCEKGYNSSLGAFTQSYGSEALDANVLVLALVGFLPPEDPRIGSTVAAVQRELTYKGLLRRYKTEDTMDGVGGSEGCFLACSFWLVDNLTLLGRHDEARTLFDKLLSLRNDVGLLAEEYDVDRNCLAGNFPQAFSHLALIDSAYCLQGGVTPARPSAGQNG